MPSANGLRHPASASCLGRHLRLAGRCPNNFSLFPPLAAVVVVAGHIQRKNYFKLNKAGASADAPALYFHGWGRNEKRQLQRRFLRKRGAAGKRCRSVPSSVCSIWSQPPSPDRGKATLSGGAQLPQSKPDGFASSLWEGAFGMAAKVAAKVQSARRQKPPPSGEVASRSDDGEGSLPGGSCRAATEGL